jgi:hypothetical protein
MPVALVPVAEIQVILRGLGVLLWMEATVDRLEILTVDFATVMLMLSFLALANLVPGIFVLRLRDLTTVSRILVHVGTLVRNLSTIRHGTMAVVVVIRDRATIAGGMIMAIDEEVISETIITPTTIAVAVNIAG